MVANNPFSMHQSDTTSLTSASMITRLQQINVKASMITQLQQINVKVNEDDITSFCNPINRVSRFEHIDNLISDAKKRLSTGYAKPVLTFQYF